jgi:hypothetical protein
MLHPMDKSFPNCCCLWMTYPKKNSPYCSDEKAFNVGGGWTNRSRNIPSLAVFLNLKGPRNRFQRLDTHSLCSLAGQYDNPIPNLFLALIDCSKIPALNYVFNINAHVLVDKPPVCYLTHIYECPCLFEHSYAGDRRRVQYLVHQYRYRVLKK